MVIRDRAAQKQGKGEESTATPLTMSGVMRKLLKGEALVDFGWVESWRERLSALASGLALVEDPRDRSGLKHPLVSVLAITVLGSMCGGDDGDSIYAWAVSQRVWLASFLELPNGVPSQDTILRVLAAVDPASFRTAFIAWVDSTMGTTFAHGEQVAIDGKTARRSGGGRGNESPVHVVSAVVASRSLVIAQLPTEKKSNEITAIPKLLQLLSLRGALVSIDAMGCQTEIASTARRQGADYLVAVKDNQPTLHREIREAFDIACSTEPAPRDAAQRLAVVSASSSDAGHGRVEQRTAWVITRANAPALFDRWMPATMEWPDIACVIRLDVTRTNKKTGVSTTETRHLICSRQLDAADAISSVRAHWVIENGLHWVLDVTFAEDRSRVRTNNAAANFVTVRHIAHGLLRRHQGDLVSVAKRRVLCALYPAYREFLLGTPT